LSLGSNISEALVTSSPGQGPAALDIRDENQRHLSRKRDKNLPALEWFDRALALDPANLEALSNRGLALQELGRDSGHARIPLLLDPAYPEALRSAALF